jgi:hypothetical protein
MPHQHVLPAHVVPALSLLPICATNCTVSKKLLM